MSVAINKAVDHLLDVMLSEDEGEALVAKLKGALKAFAEAIISDHVIGSSHMTWTAVPLPSGAVDAPAAMPYTIPSAPPQPMLPPAPDVPTYVAPSAATS